MSLPVNNTDDAGHQLPAYSEHQEAGPKAELTGMRLRRSVFAALVAVAYSTMLLFSWIVTAISTQRPLKLPGYTHADFNDQLPFFMERQFAESRRIFDAAQVVGSVAYTITIPVISTVVAAVLVVRLQRDNRRSYTLRQIAMLADKNWNSPLNLIAASVRPVQHFTWYLWAATTLTVLGKSGISASPNALLTFCWLYHRATSIRFARL